MKKNKKGFTLIELVIVIVVLAIIAAIAIPVTTGVIKNAEKVAAETNVLSIATSIKTTLALLEDSSNLSSILFIPDRNNVGKYLEIQKSIENAIDKKLEGKYLIRIDFGTAAATNIDKGSFIIYYREEGFNAYEKGYIYINGEITYDYLIFTPDP